MHAAEAHPAQLTHLLPEHWASLVQKQAMPAAPHVPIGEVTLSQLPTEHAHAVATDVSDTQFALSAVPLPVHAPLHWPLAFTHLPLEQSESAAHRQAVCVALHTGRGERVVRHA